MQKRVGGEGGGVPDAAWPACHCLLWGRGFGTSKVWLGAVRVWGFLSFFPFNREIPGNELDGDHLLEESTINQPGPPRRPERRERSPLARRAHSESGTYCWWLPARYSRAAGGKISRITKRCRSSHSGTLINCSKNQALAQPWALELHQHLQKWKQRR